MSNNIDNINSMIAQAREAAATAAAQVPAAVNSNLPATAAPVTGGRPVSMREMVAEAGVRADHFMKVSPAGFLIGKDTKSFQDELEVEFRLNAAKPYWGLRFGNPAKYLKSYDRMVDARTKKSWATVIAECTAADPRCTGDYPALELAFTLCQDVLAKDGSKLAEKGQTVGWNSSITNWALWTQFIEPYFNLIDAGIITDNTLVRGKVIHTQRTKDGNTWGLLDFADFQVVEDQAAQAA